MKYNLQFLNENYERLNKYFYGLGFIKIKVDEFSEYHIYTDKLKKNTINEVHNHRSSFTSTVLKGVIYNMLFTFEPMTNGVFVKNIASCEKNGNKPLISESGDIKNICSFKTVKDEYYFLHRDVVHDVIAENNTITFIQKSKDKRQFAEVFRLKDAVVNCPFDYNVSKNDLNQIIKEVLDDY